MNKLLINGKEVEPKKKIKLYIKLSPTRVKSVLENPDELEKLRAELEEAKDK